MLRLYTLFFILFGLISQGFPGFGCVQYAPLHPAVSTWRIGAELTGVFGPEVDHEWELICCSRGKHMVKWSTNENGKLLPLVGPTQVHAGGGGGQVMMDVPCPRCCWYDQKNNRTTPAPLPSVLCDNRNTDVRWSLAGAQNCLCAKLPWEWEFLFICWMDPIMVLKFRCIVNIFHHNNKDLTLQRSNRRWWRTCWTESDHILEENNSAEQI